jgi:streptogramin lyase
VDEDQNLYVAVPSSTTTYKVMRIADKMEALAPNFSPAPGSYSGEQTITLTAFNPDALIHFRTDGIEPTELDPFVRSGEAVTISSNVILTARAFRGDLTPSRLVTGTYRLSVRFSFAPPPQSVTNGTLLKITGLTSNTIVRYTIDGSDVTDQSSIYNGPIVLMGDQTIKAVGSAPGLNSSSNEVYYGLLEPESVAIRTLAGSGIAGMQDGHWYESQFNRPEGICVDHLGNVFVADRGNKAIRKILPDGTVQTLSPSNALSDVLGICADEAGNLFVTDPTANQVVKISPEGNSSVVAEGGNLFRNLGHIEVSSEGELFVGDWAVVKKIMADGSVELFGGTGVNNANGWSGDVGLGIGTNGEVFAGSSNGRVYKVATLGGDELFAGSLPGHSDGARLNARFTDQLYINHPIAREVAVERSGAVYVADRNWIRKISTTGRVSTLLPAHGSTLAGPLAFATGVAVDNAGNIYVSDTLANKIVKMAPDVDGDGILDTEEGDGTPFKVGQNDHLTDSDQDGLSNSDEILAGTDPSRKESVFRITVSNTGLQWNSSFGRVYRIEKSVDFRTWTPITEAIPGTGALLSFTLDSAGAAFYRVVVTQL